MERATETVMERVKCEIVVKAGNIPWANLHQRDRSTCEENGEEEK